MARIDADTSIDSLKRTIETTMYNLRGLQYAGATAKSTLVFNKVGASALPVQSKAYDKKIQPQNQTVSSDVTILCSSWHLTSIQKTQVRILAESRVQS